MPEKQRTPDVIAEQTVDVRLLVPGNGDGELFSGSSLTAHRHHEAARSIIMAAVAPRDEEELAASKRARDEKERRQTQETQDRIWAATQLVSEVMRQEEEALRQASAEV